MSAHLFSWIPHLPTFCSCGLVVNGTVDSKDNREEMAREVADIRKYPLNNEHESYLPTCVTELSTCELVVDDTVDGKDNLAEKNRKDADIIRMYHFC